MSADELLSLTSERTRLLDKLFDQGLSHKEKRRLEYVRWSLDRIEDAEHGHDLDDLEAAISHYEKLRDDIVLLDQQLRGLVVKRR